MIDEEKIKEATAAIINAIGEDPKREGLVGTPERVARMYVDLFSGLGEDPAAPLATGFEETRAELIVLRNIPFFSICEHHFLPFVGTADIGYVPKARVVGASKLARTLEILARRPQMQERITDELADTVVGALEPEGVAVVIRAEHQCMTLRGAKKAGSTLITSAARGTLKTRADVRQEFFALLREP